MDFFAVSFVVGLVRNSVCLLTSNVGNSIQTAGGSTHLLPSLVECRQFKPNCRMLLPPPAKSG